MLTFNNNVIQFNGFWLGVSSSTTKHATVHLRLPDVPDTFTDSGTTWYPYAVETLWTVVSYTGDNINNIAKYGRSCRCTCVDNPLYSTNTKEFNTGIGTVLDWTTPNLQINVHATGSESDWAYELRARSNVPNDTLYVNEYNRQTQQYQLHQVNPRNTQDAAGCWNYGRGQAVVAYSGVMANWPQLELSVSYYKEGNEYCLPNPYKSYKDVVADLTWTE